MREAIDRIESWIAKSGGATALYREPMLRSAVERQLLVISEAATRISRKEPGWLERQAPHIAWRSVRGLGNVLRHEYQNVDPGELVEIVTEHLGALTVALDGLGGRTPPS